MDPTTSSDIWRLHDLLRRSRRSVELDLKAHERIAHTNTLSPTTRQIHEVEAQTLHDVLLEINEVLETTPCG